MDPAVTPSMLSTCDPQPATNVQPESNSAGAATLVDGHQACFPAFLLLLPTSPGPLRVGILLPVPAGAVGGCQQQLVVPQGPGWGRMYNEQHRGDFGLWPDPSSFCHTDFDASWELATDPRTPSGMLALSFPSPVWGHSVPGGTGWHAWHRHIPVGKSGKLCRKRKSPAETFIFILYTSLFTTGFQSRLFISRGAKALSAGELHGVVAGGGRSLAHRVSPLLQGVGRQRPQGSPDHAGLPAEDPEPPSPAPPLPQQGAGATQV